VQVWNFTPKDAKTLNFELIQSLLELKEKKRIEEEKKHIEEEKKHIEEEKARISN
jgi:hypothetical protein